MELLELHTHGHTPRLSGSSFLHFLKTCERHIAVNDNSNLSILFVWKTSMTFYEKYGFKYHVEMPLEDRCGKDDIIDGETLSPLIQPLILDLDNRFVDCIEENVDMEGPVYGWIETCCGSDRHGWLNSDCMEMLQSDVTVEVFTKIIPEYLGCYFPRNYHDYFPPRKKRKFVSTQA